MQGGWPTIRDSRLGRFKLWHIEVMRAMIKSRELARRNIVTLKKLGVLEIKALCEFLLGTRLRIGLRGEQDIKTEENVTFIVFRPFRILKLVPIPTLWNCTRSMGLGYLGPREVRISRASFHDAGPQRLFVFETRWLFKAVYFGITVTLRWFLNLNPLNFDMTQKRWRRRRRLSNVVPWWKNW